MHQLIANRGCQNSCTYCSVGLMKKDWISGKRGERFNRTKSVDYLIAQVNDTLARYPGFRMINFVVDLPLAVQVVRQGVHLEHLDRRRMIGQIFAFYIISSLSLIAPTPGLAALSFGDLEIVFAAETMAAPAPPE